MLATLTELKDAAHIDAFLADISATGDYGKSDSETVLAAAALLAPQRAAALIEHTVKANAAKDPGACADLLARDAAAPSARRPVRDLIAAATALVDALPGDPARAPKQPADSWWRPQDVDADLVADLVTALERIDATLAGRATEHLLAWPKTYGLDAVILPAIRRLTSQARTRGKAGVQRLRAACVQHLRARGAEPLEPPADWTRAAKLSCRCAHCGELARFLRRPDEQTWTTLKAVEAVRVHVAETVQRSHCDLNLATEQRGRPYSLVCTKNQASYERRAKQRHEDLQDLERLAPNHAHGMTMSFLMESLAELTRHHDLGQAGEMLANALVQLLQPGRDRHLRVLSTKSQLPSDEIQNGDGIQLHSTQPRRRNSYQRGPQERGRESCLRLRCRHALALSRLAHHRAGGRCREKAVQQYETALERAQRLARESESRAATQATWIDELKRLGYDTEDEERALALMKEDVWSAYAELSRQQAVAQ